MPLFASYADFVRLERKIDLSYAALQLIIRKDTDMAKTLAEIENDAEATLAKVQAQTSALTAIAQVITDQKTKIADLQEQLDDAIASQADPAQLQAISDAIKQTNDALDANAAAEAALANTEAVAPPVVEPPPPSVTSTAPVLNAVSPPTGIAGDTVTLTGSDFVSTEGVSFNGIPVPSTGINVTDDGTAIVIVPAGTGSVPVVITTGAGSSAPAMFTYNS
jgi:hypothetical protein